MKSTRDKVKKEYEDKRNWKLTPPSVRFIAKKVGISPTVAYRYICEFSTVSKKR